MYRCLLKRTAKEMMKDLLIVSRTLELLGIATHRIMSFICELSENLRTLWQPQVICLEPASGKEVSTLKNVADNISFLHLSGSDFSFPPNFFVGASGNRSYSQSQSGLLWQDLSSQQEVGTYLLSFLHHIEGIQIERRWERCKNITVDVDCSLQFPFILGKESYQQSVLHKSRLSLSSIQPITRTIKAIHGSNLGIG